MARLAFAARAQADLDRLVEFLVAEDAALAAAAVDLIFDALDVLHRHPLIGRAVDDKLRELVISRGKSGYVALYEYRQAEDVALVLAIRHQREAGFAEE